MSTPFLRTKVPCMAKWVLLLSMAAFSSYPQLTEGRSLQQGPLPVQETELDQCEFAGYDEYGEQCGSKIVQLPLCNPGQRIRGWQCDPKTLEDDFTPDNLDICQSCPPGFYQKWYNKCEMCHPCTVCREGETEEKACEMDKDTNCTVISTTESLQPFDTPLEATVSTRAPPLKPPSTAMPTNPTPTEETSLEIITTSRTAPTIESPFDLRTTPHDPKGWLHVAFIVVSSVLALLLVLITIACCRERFKKRRLRALVHKQEFELNPMNGDVPHHNEEQPNERCPLMDEGVEPERNQVHRDDAEKNDCNDGPNGPPADVEEHYVDPPPPPPAPPPAPPAPPAPPPAPAPPAPPPPSESATGADGDDEADSKDGGHVVNKPMETLVGGSNGATGVPPDDQPNGTSNATTTSASGNCLTGGATSSKVQDNIQKESALCPNGALGGVDSAYSSPNATPEKGATNAGIDCNGTADTDDAKHDVKGSGVGNDVPVVESLGVPGSGACGHSPNGADNDAGEPNTAPKEVKPRIQAGDVVTTQFLQCVAQKVSLIKIKEICRMLSLEEKVIEDIEYKKHKDEQDFEFLKKLLGQNGKDLTYRSLLQALNNSKNKHYADKLIEEFDIVMRWDDP